MVNNNHYALEYPNGVTIESIMESAVDRFVVVGLEDLAQRWGEILDNYRNLKTN